ncbi:PfkB family carbohydrate kinase [Thermoleptolyngbya sichuanensis XZ-Cy5]|uniref:PfkB family carbohydrate kinase n=1 Tax=Thermoleptolyngbya sichuanensis TaxID=2885951 RepID=UPI00240E3FE2|nr:PfkB family carbohydrate kinase [Thermoleptolyngbya sichuanensis]MDG2616787.1 PfkB family carbohydrate kinase [Thermoleptolyngbya sichuanensis XZ-Cy5]
MNMGESSRGRGVFVGLTTLDLIYQVEAVPASNQKVVAQDVAIAAGGPATNAAVTFAHLGGDALLLSSLGQHSIAGSIRADLATWGVQHRDLDPERQASPAVSSILVTAATGDRAVVSRNAVGAQVAGDRLPADLMQALKERRFDVVLIDGHQMAIGEAIAQQSRALGIPVVVDGGSWKPGFEAVLRHTDYAICSANFLPPGCDSADVLPYLRSLGVAQVARTHGSQPVEYLKGEHAEQVAVPTISPVDTLGAGDIFHGAFCHFILQLGFEAAIAQAAQVAARACQSFGPRRWMEAPPHEENPRFPKPD